MIGGKIEEWIIVSREEAVDLAGLDQWDINRCNERFDVMEAFGLQLVRFHVVDHFDRTRIKAALPASFLGENLLEPGLPIWWGPGGQHWWQTGEVYITIPGLGAQVFAKIGYTY